VSRRGLRAIVLLLAAGASAACTSVVRQTDDEIRIDVGVIGEIAPGTRAWWGHLEARDHCARNGKDAELVDLRGSVATYRCVAPEKS